MIERMKERIIIQKDSMAIDRYSNHTKSWTDFYSCWAYANTFAKDEKPDVVTTDNRSITFEVRYCSKLSRITSTGYRVIFRNDVYNILAVDMMNWNKKTIHLKCQKEVRS